MRFDEAIKEGLQIGIGADRIRERMERVLDKKENKREGGMEHDTGSTADETV